MPVVLIVEDEAEIATMVSDVLREAGHMPHTVLLGTEALSMAQQLRPDVVLLDLMLPDRDGYAVAGDLQGDAQLCDVPIVLMTAFHRAADRAADIGTPYSLGKPFNLGDLFSVLERALASSSPSSSVPAP
jgi:two-component system OmpR family response regulator